MGQNIKNWNDSKRFARKIMIKTFFKKASAIILLFFITSIVMAVPLINYTSPTPSNNTYTRNSSIEINISINEQNLSSLNYNWNGTNYTLYNNSLILMMNFDNISALGENSTYVKDLSRYGNDGTVEGGATWNASGKYGGAYSFNGTNQIDAGDVDELDGVQQFTVSAWVKYSTLADYDYVFSKGDVSDYSTNSIVMGSSGSGYGGNNDVLLRISNAVDTYAYTSADLLNANQWHHWVMVYDGTQSTNAAKLRFYFDNVQQTLTYSTNFPTTTPSNAYHLVLSGWSTNYNNMSGLIDDFFIYNRSLSEDEIYQQYASNLQKFNQTQWYLYVNQSKNSTSGLDDGIYSYQTYATDLAGNNNQTELRTITIGTGAPVVTASKTYSNYEQINQMTVDPNISVTDGENNVTGATVSIGDGYVSSEDYLNYTTINGITGSYSTTTGILTLTGNRSGSDYQAAFRNVSYWNSNINNPNTSQRNITFAIGNNSLYYPGTGHYYEYISAGLAWTDARNAAELRTFYGLQGYLATINSSGENTFLEDKVSGDAWIGANDSVVEGEWRWVTGPESDTLFFNGTGASNTAFGYNNWASTEPNDYNSGNPGEDFAYMISSASGTWNDYPTDRSLSYFTEYGGMAGDPTLHLTAMVIVNVTDIMPPTAPSITVPTNGVTLTSSNIWVNGTTSADTTNVTVYINGTITNNSVSVSGMIFNISNVPLGSDGVHEINVSSKDAAGNVNTTNATVIVTVDTTAPTISIGSDDVALNKGDTALITFTLSETSVDFIEGDVTVAGGTLSAWTAVNGTSYTAIFTPTDESTDAGTVNVAITKFTDAAGNANTAAPQLSMTVDTVAPTFTIQYYSDSGLTASHGNNPKLKAGTYYIKITSSETLSGTPTISIDAEGTSNDVTDGATVAVSGNDYKYTRLIVSDAAAIGSVLENISITGTDAASNTATNANPTNEASKAAYTDTNTPFITIITPLNTTYGTTSIVLNITTNQVVNATYSLNGGINQSLFDLTTSGNTIITGAEGANYITVYANDTAGNLNSSIVYFTVDTTEPLWAPEPSNQTLIAGSDFTYDVNATDIQTITYGINDSQNFSINATTGTITNNVSLATGIYGLNITATDASSNVNSSSIIITVSNPPPASSSGGGGGGGSGGSGVVIAEPLENIVSSERNEKDLAAGKSVTYTFNKNQDIVYELSFIGKENENNVAMRIEILKGISKQVTESAPGLVYRNVNIIAGTKNIGENLIKFKVKDSWLLENGFESSDIRLVKWVANKWIILETRVINNEDGYTHFISKSMTFSIYAITGIREEVIIPALEVTQKPTPLTTEKPAPQPEGKKPVWIWMILAVLLIGALVYIIKRKKDKRK